MAVTTQEVMSDMFQRALESFDATLKTGVKFQEEATKWWTDALSGLGSPEDWQKRARAIGDDAIPVVQKNAEEYLRVFDDGSRASLELLNKAFEAGRAESVGDLQSQTRELWEASLGVMRNHAQALVKANANAVEAWADLARRAAADGKPAAASGSAAST